VLYTYKRELISFWHHDSTTSSFQSSN